RAARARPASPAPRARDAPRWPAPVRQGDRGAALSAGPDQGGVRHRAAVARSQHAGPLLRHLHIHEVRRRELRLTHQRRAHPADGTGRTARDRHRRARGDPQGERRRPRDIYDAAISGEFAVDSKFSPTYTMVLNLLRTRSAEAAELLLDSSFGQYQALERSARWGHRKANLEAELHDLRLRRFQHPRVPCTERTLTSYLTTTTQLGEAQLALRRVRRGHWTDARRGRYGKAGSDPGPRYEAVQRTTRSLQERLNESPCRNCPYFGEHRAHHHRIADIETTLAGAEEELERSQHRFRREFRAHRAVLRAAGFLEGDEPTDLGRLAGSLYGESSLLVADAIASGILDGLKP